VHTPSAEPYWCGPGQRKRQNQRGSSRLRKTPPQKCDDMVTAEKKKPVPNGTKVMEILGSKKRDDEVTFGTKKVLLVVPKPLIQRKMQCRGAEIRTVNFVAEKLTTDISLQWRERT